MPYVNNKDADQSAHPYSDYSLISAFVVPCMDSRICVVAMSRTKIFINSNILHEVQQGFREKRSCETQLINAY